MTATAILLPSEVGSALSLQELAHSWESDKSATGQGESLKRLVTSALKQAEGLQLAWSLFTQDGEVWETGWYAQRVRTVEFLVGTVKDTLERTRQILDQSRTEHPHVCSPARIAEIESNLSTVRSIAAQVRQTLVWLDRPRAPANEETIQRSRQQLDRGEGEFIGEILARVANGGSLVKE